MPPPTRTDTPAAIEAAIGPPAGRHDALVLGLLHVAVGVACFAAGMRMSALGVAGDWDYFWQTVPIEDLRQRPWSSLWHAHSQPPGYSLWGLFWLSLFPGHFPSILQPVNMVLGGLTTGMIYALARGMSGSRPAGLAAGLLTAFNPALLYFEAHVLYETVLVALVTASAWMLWRALVGGGTRWLIGMIVALNLLVMSRSFYHLVFLAGALVLAWPLWRAMRPRTVALALAAAVALPAGWYGKNLFQYGFFGSSSWMGIGWASIVIRGVSAEELAELADQGLVSPMTASRWPYQHTPRSYEEFGFDKVSNVPLLSRNDWHNINVVDISRLYGMDARTLIRLYPGRYLGWVHNAYRKFSLPVSRFDQLGPHRMDHVFWEPLYADVLYGHFPAEGLGYILDYELGSFYYFYLPLLLIGGAAWTAVAAIRRRTPSGPKVDPAAAARPWVMGYLLYLSLYVVLVGTLFEYPENVRFRFAIEPLQWVAGIVILRSSWLWLNRTRV